MQQSFQQRGNGLMVMCVCEM